MSYARIKKVLDGEFVDFTIDEVEGEFLGLTVQNFQLAVTELGYEAFALASAPQAPAGTAPQAPVSGEIEVAAADGQPGQLAKRFQSAVIEITPRQDDKAQVAFYGDDIKQPLNDYPYVTNVYTSKTWVEKFANICPFTLDHFRKAQRFAVRADVEVRFGNKRANQGQGNYYRNISAITPAPGLPAQEITTFEQPRDTQPAQVEGPEDIPF